MQHKPRGAGLQVARCGFVLPRWERVCRTHPRRHSAGPLSGKQKRQTRSQRTPAGECPPRLSRAAGSSEHHRAGAADLQYSLNCTDTLAHPSRAPAKICTEIKTMLPNSMLLALSSVVAKDCPVWVPPVHSHRLGRRALCIWHKAKT